MKKILMMVLTGAGMLAMADAAAPSVTVDRVKQRWPFEEKVDIDFTLNASERCDVKLNLKFNQIEGQKLGSTIFEFSGTYAPGANHITWDPAANGFGGRTLTDLIVEAETPVAVSGRTYLVFDLVNNTYEYTGTRPDGGWAADDYKGNKMVFRRVPAGTYTLGNTASERRAINNGGWGTTQQQNANRSRQVTISSDYYVAVHLCTYTQYYRIVGSGATGFNYVNTSYDIWRGDTNATDGVNWPLTGPEEVGANSLIGRFRAKFGNRFNIDLPTVNECEIAQRAGTTTIFWNGGTQDSTIEELKALWAQFSAGCERDANDKIIYSEAVGLRQPNPWDIYNANGMVYVWCLDARTPTQNANKYEDNTKDAESGVDPVGETIAAGEPLMRMTCGSGYATGTGYNCLSGAHRGMLPDSDQKAAVRFAIHLADPRLTTDARTSD